MITLKTLPQATAQEVFDQVKNHLLTQNERCRSYTGCFYRFHNLKCAAGCFIADDEYISEMETNHWLRLVDMKMVPSTHADLICVLQKVHDEWEPEIWPEELKKLAESFDLKYE